MALMLKGSYISLLGDLRRRRGERRLQKSQGRTMEKRWVDDSGSGTYGKALKFRASTSD